MTPDPKGQGQDVVKRLEAEAASMDQTLGMVRIGHRDLMREAAAEIRRLRSEFAALTQEGSAVAVIAYEEDEGTWLCRTPEAFEDIGLDFDPSQDVRGTLILARPTEGGES